MRMEKEGGIGNEFTVLGDMAFIRLTQGKVAVIDKDDIELVLQHRWFFHAGYAVNSSIGKMHSLILAPKYYQVYGYHLNNDKLDNRRKNLTMYRSAEYVEPGRGKSNKYLGVTKAGNKWSAVYKGEYLGRYKTEQEALDALMNYKKDIWI